MVLFALLIAQVLDPVRMVAVLAAWFAWKVLHGRVGLLLVFLGGAAVFLTILISQMQYGETSTKWFVGNVVVGFVANCTLVGAAYGVRRLFKPKSKISNGP